MRPITLKMTAFGPYKDTETIDFTKLGDHTLFMIAGPTGAGKTTIFDGISFALYGSASGSDRDQTSMLRSDFADDDTHTAVELIFELKGSVYRILRQLGHVKQGNKTKTGDRYEFYKIVDDREVPCVDRQIVSEINQKAEELIGLTQDQFKQIVMLPQGEFRKLLTSETQNKEAILRKIFKTENYQRISEKAKERKDLVEQDLQQAKQAYDHTIQHIYATLQKREGSLLFQVLDSEHFNAHQVLYGLDAEISFYKKEIVRHETAYDHVYKLHDQKQEALHKAKALNDRFVELAEKETQLDALNHELPQIKLQENQLQEAERAKQIQMFEKQLDDWTIDARKKALQFKKAADHLEQAEQSLERAKTVYNEEKDNQPERDEIVKTLDRLIDFKPVVEQNVEEKQQLVQLKQHIKQIENKGQQMENALKEAHDMFEKDSETLQQLDQSVRFLPEKQLKLNHMQELAKILTHYIKLEKDQFALEKEIASKENKWHAAKQLYEQKESKWLQHQASLLASHLHDGEACPVCGSEHHPNKATFEGELVTREQLNQLKSQLDERYQELQNVRATYKALADQLTTIKKELLSEGVHATEGENDLQSLTEAGKALRDEVEGLEKSLQESDRLKQQLNQQRESIQQLEKEKNEVEQQMYQLKSDYQSKQAVQQEKLRRIPKDMQDLNRLERQIKETNILKEKLFSQWEVAQKQLEETKEAYTKAISAKTHMQERWKEAQSKREEAEVVFMTAVKEAKFESVTAYRQAKMSEHTFKTLQNTIEQFKHRLTTLTEQVSELKEVLKDKQKIDLSVIEEELTQLKEQYELAFEQLNTIKGLYLEALSLKDKLMIHYNQMVKLEQQLAIVNDLYDVLRGQNEQKMSFERYLQIEYLEQIIDAANQRLKDISHGQFLLLRSDRQESHGRQSGLSLDVYDSYTGQTRDVKTLSGGEKFNASLCLALGMSDVIQSFQGNIKIDTMFIDEGFGSLDEESLNKSVETLLNIQKTGRMIGIISHVQELKQMFSAVLEVKKTKEGYSQTAFLIK